jgi:hypothetical protein
MAAPELLMAYPARMGDNGAHAEFDWLPGPDMTVDGEPKSLPVWGTATKPAWASSWRAAGTATSRP